MKKRKFSLLLSLLSISLAAFLFKGLFALENRDAAPGADMIFMKSTEIFEKHERPDVVFFHDRHMKAVQRMNKDCSACHLREEGFFEESFSTKFKRLEDKSKQGLMELYHDNCVGCHEKVSPPAKGGPVVCGGCHKKDRKEHSFVNARRRAGFDKSLHHRHLKTADDCETCHHDYDEGSCRYCHKGKKTEKYPVTMKKASHAVCLGCHIKSKGEGEKSGPMDCRGCHDLKRLREVKKLDSVPRLKVKDEQSDFFIIKAAEDLEPNRKKMTSFVPFNHKIHERRVDSCRECHHKEISSCNNCHSSAGKEEGAFINLEKSMHKIDSKSSCLGCHHEKQKKPDCAGCHSLAKMTRKNFESSCLACHISKPSEMKIIKLEEEAAAAKKLLKQKKPAKGGLDETLIPKTIVIKELSQKYGPVNFPHLKVIKSLAERIKNDKLAEFFHNKKETLCQGCHHNSPKSENPPPCVSCHYKSYNSDNPLQPGIIGAYHIQCEGCHERMKIEEFTGCEACHQPVEPR